MKNLYSLYVRLLHSLQSPFLLLIRLYWGWSFMQAGLGKLGNIQRPIEGFTQLGIPFPEFTAYFVASVEAVCGFFLLIGFLSRIITLPLVITMIVALLTAHGKATFNLWADPETFLAEAPILYLYASLVVMLFGPGKFSVDYLIARCKARRFGGQGGCHV